jgi:branched-chain amino acid aminotransferase
VKNGKIFTPPLNSGCLEGVTRGILMEIAPEAGVSIVEQSLKLDDLYSADEVFISSTNRGILGIAEIAGHKLPFSPGPVTQQLISLLNSYLNDYVTRRIASAAR